MSKCTREWSCVTKCGACCRLAPNERSEALEALDPDSRLVYLDLVGKDGWCRHYDVNQRSCRIYKDRPEFCKVSSLVKLFKVEKSKADEFAIMCCRQQIRSIYGGKSKEMRRFVRNLSLNSNNLTNN